MNSTKIALSGVGTGSADLGFHEGVKQGTFEQSIDLDSQDLTDQN